MPDLSGLGDLVLTVGGDITPLESALNEIPAAAQQAAAQIQAAFDALPSATEEVNASLANLSAGLADAGKAAEDVYSKLGELGQGDVYEGLANLAGAAEQLPPAFHETSQAAGEADSKLGEFITTGLELAGVVLTLEALKEALVGAVEAFGEFQRAGEALTFIAGSATDAADAMERIPALADALGVSITSLESAQQKFALFGVDLQNIPGLMEAIADASRASGNAFDTVAASFERMDQSGKLMQRTLVQTGLNMDDIAAAMGKTGESVKQLQQDFQNLGTGEEGAAQRAQVLYDATEKMRGLAQQTANDVEGATTQIGNAFHEMAVNVGAALANMVGAGNGFDLLKTAIKGVETFIVALIGFVTQAIDLLKGFYNISLDVALGIGTALSDLASGKGFGQAASAIKGMAVTIASDFHSMNEEIATDGEKNGKLIDGIWAKTTESVETKIKHIPLVFHDTTDQLGKLIAEFAAHAELDLSKIPQGFDTYISQLADGGEKATQMVTKINSDISKALDLIGQGATADQVELVPLMDALERAKEFADQEAFSKLAVQVSEFAAKFPQALAVMDAASLDFVNAMDTMSRNVQDDFQKLTDQQVVSNWEKSFEQLAASTEKLNNTTTKWQEEYYKNTTQQIAITGTLDNAMGTFAGHTITFFERYTELVKELNALGLQTQQQMESQIAGMEHTLALATAMNQPLTIRLALQNDIVTAQLKEAAAIGESGTATLALTEKLKAVQIQQGILMDQTMGLSNLYTGMMKSFSTAWDSLGKGIGDALVSGHNFGAVMMSVLDTLKKSISELVVNYLMGMLKDALLQNGEIMKTFNSIFNGIFGSGGDVAKGLASTTQAFDDTANAVQRSTGALASSVESSTKNMSGAFSQASSSIGSSVASMVSGLTLVATVVGAIAGIFSAIELAHTNTLLARIEESTRRVDIITEQNLQPDIAQIRNNTNEIYKFGWNFMQPAMQQVMLKMDAIIEVLKEIDQGVWTGGGSDGTTTGTASALGTTLQATIAIPQATAMLDQAGQALVDAAGTTTDAAVATQAAADHALQTSLTQADLTNTATAATVHSAENLSTAAQSMTSAADAFSYEGLKAADAALTQKLAADALAASAAALTAVMNRTGTGGSSSMTVPFLAPQGGPLIGPPPVGGFGGFTPFATPNVALPNVGPSGASTGGMAFANPYTYSGGNAGNSPVSVNVSGGPQFLQSLFTEFVRNLQTQGIRLTRG